MQLEVVHAPLTEAFVLVAAPLALALSLGAAHPHLFFTSSDVAALRAKSSTTHKPIADNIVKILGQHLTDPAPTTADYSDKRFFGNQVAAFAFAWQLTGDARYAAIARTQLLTYLTWSDWGFGEGAPDLNTAHMLLGVSCAYDWLVGYSGLSSTEAKDIAARLGTEAQRLADSIPTNWWPLEYVQNHNWIDTAGLGLAGLVLQGEDARAASWQSLATTNLANIAKAIGPITDGSWHEGIPYQAYGLAMSMPFWTALARTGVDYTDMGILRGYGHFRLATGVAEAFRQSYLPYGDFFGWSPEQTTEILRYTAARFHDREAEAAAERWFAAGSRTTLVPELWYEVFEYLWYDPTVVAADVSTLPLDSHFSDLQSSVLRSSWGAGDLTLAFKAMPYGGRFNWDRVRTGGNPGGHIEWGHDHNDDMSFWLYGSGTWLAPEAMGYDAGKNTGYTDWANATSFHNSILVDGQGQLGDARASDSEWNNPWFWERDAAPLRTASVADYALSGGRGAKLFDPALGITRWDRLVVLSRHRYALVWDDIASTASHAYDWVCHFPDGAAPDGHGWVQGTAKNGQVLGVRVVSPALWTTQVGSQTAELMWKFDPDAQTSFVRVRPATAQASQQFLAALVPVGTAAWASKPAVTPLDASDPGAGIVIAEGAAGPEERWIFSRTGANAKIAGDLVLTSGLVGMAARSNGVPVRAFLVGPGRLSDENGARDLLVSKSAASIEADLRGTTLVVTGEGVADFSAYAPGATRATLNGVAVSIGTAGSMVGWPASAVVSDGGTDGGPPPVDAGTTSDAGTPPGPGVADAGSHPDAGSADAGWSLPDAGLADAGSSPADAGVADAGSFTPDAGAQDAGGQGGGSAPDAGVADAGSAAPDAGGVGQVSDAGTPPSDAGAAPGAGGADAGATTADAGPVADAGGTTASDAGATGTTNPPSIPVGGGGCAGCGAGPGANASSAGLLAILWALSRRKRTRRRS